MLKDLGSRIFIAALTLKKKKKKSKSKRKPETIPVSNSWRIVD